MICSEKIKKVLVVTLTNIGDIVLTIPAIERLKQAFPAARFSILLGPEGRDLFAADPRVDDIIIYNKHASLKDKWQQFITLRRQKFNLVVDFRNTLWPFILGNRYSNQPFLPLPSDIQHKVLEHLYRLKPLKLPLPEGEISALIYNSADDGKYIDKIIAEDNPSGKKIIAVCPGARSALKRWWPENYAFVCDCLNQREDVIMVMLGAESDRAVIVDIIKRMRTRAMDLSGKMNLRELAAFLKRCALLLTNDSAPMHIGWAVGVPIVALFGPSDPKKYAPLNGKNFVVSAKLSCAPCKGFDCRNGARCLENIDKKFVVNCAEKILDEKV